MLCLPEEDLQLYGIGVGVRSHTAGKLPEATESISLPFSVT